MSGLSRGSFCIGSSIAGFGDATGFGGSSSTGNLTLAAAFAALTPCTGGDTDNVGAGAGSEGGASREKVVAAGTKAWDDIGGGGGREMPWVQTTLVQAARREGRG